MAPPLRLLFVRGARANSWRAAFDIVQAAAALDLPVELAFAGAGLGLILPDSEGAHGQSARGAYASLELLGIETVYALANGQSVANARSVLPVSWLQPSSWQSWLRRAPLQVW